MRKGIEEEVKQLLTERPRTVIELAQALGYKTPLLWGIVRSAGRFKIRELEDKGLVECDNTALSHWKEEEAEK